VVLFDELLAAANVVHASKQIEETQRAAVGSATGFSGSKKGGLDAYLRPFRDILKRKPKAKPKESSLDDLFSLAEKPKKRR
jgi:hypothetical protein